MINITRNRFIYLINILSISLNSNIVQSYYLSISLYKILNFKLHNTKPELLESAFNSLTDLSSIKISAPSEILNVNSLKDGEYVNDVNDVMGEAKLGSSDPYSDILDMNTIINEKDLNQALVSQWTIDIQDNPRDARSAKSVKKPPQWEHWDDFMESEFGDMDQEIIKEEDKWMLELRDTVELKRGLIFMFILFNFPYYFYLI